MRALQRQCMLFRMKRPYRVLVVTGSNDGETCEHEAFESAATADSARKLASATVARELSERASSWRVLSARAARV